MEADSLGCVNTGVHIFGWFMFLILELFSTTHLTYLEGGLQAAIPALLRVGLLWSEQRFEFWFL
jgi:hypothetical protein